MIRTAILIPYYNHPMGLARTLSSLSHEREDFTVYLVDDGNVPVLKITEQYPFPIRIVRLEKNSGIVAALNAGLKEILTGNFDYIARIDAGDHWITGRLAAQRDYLMTHPDAVWVSCRAIAMTTEGKELFTVNYPSSDTDIRRRMHLNSACCHAGSMLCVSAVRKAGGYSANYLAAEDYEFFWRLLKMGQGANLPNVWLKYEVDETTPSISIQKRRGQSAKPLLAASLRGVAPEESRALGSAWRESRSLTRSV